MIIIDVLNVYSNDSKISISKFINNLDKDLNEKYKEKWKEILSDIPMNALKEFRDKEIAHKDHDRKNFGEINFVFIQKKLEITYDFLTELYKLITGQERGKFKPEQSQISNGIDELIQLYLKNF